MDQLQQIRVFAKVVERRSLSKAARDLGVTQPTVSKALSALEARLRSQLLLRSTRSVTVTEAGQRYYQRCRSLIDALDEADTELEEREAPRGTLKVHGPVVLGEMFLGPVAAEFQRDHPQVRCEVTCLDAFVDLVAEGADLALRLGEVKDPSVVRRRLGTMRRLLVASPGYLKVHGTPKQPGELASHRSVRFSGLPTGDQVTAGRTTVSMSPGFLSNNAVVLREALLRGLGIGLVIEFLVADDLKKGRLVEVLPAHPLSPIEVSAVFPSARFIPLRARVFVDYLVKRLATVPGMSATPSA
ncbi:MAG: LysR family transcriptional regulator [Myxococcota bacterium]